MSNHNEVISLKLIVDGDSLERDAVAATKRANDKMRAQAEAGKEQARDTAARPASAPQRFRRSQEEIALERENMEARRNLRAGLTLVNSIGRMFSAAALRSPLAAMTDVLRATHAARTLVAPRPQVYSATAHVAAASDIMRLSNVANAVQQAARIVPKPAAEMKATRPGDTARSASAASPPRGPRVATAAPAGGDEPHSSPEAKKLRNEIAQIKSNAGHEKNPILNAAIASMEQRLAKLAPVVTSANPAAAPPPLPAAMPPVRPASPIRRPESPIAIPRSAEAVTGLARHMASAGATNPITMMIESLTSPLKVLLYGTGRPKRRAEPMPTGDSTFSPAAILRKSERERSADDRRRDRTEKEPGRSPLMHAVHRLLNPPRPVGAAAPTQQLWGRLYAHARQHGIGGAARLAFRAARGGGLAGGTLPTGMFGAAGGALRVAGAVGGGIAGAAGTIAAIAGPAALIAGAIAAAVGAALEGITAKFGKYSPATIVAQVQNQMKEMRAGFTLAKAFEPLMLAWERLKGTFIDGTTKLAPSFNLMAKVLAPVVDWLAKLIQKAFPLLNEAILRTAAGFIWLVERISGHRVGNLAKPAPANAPQGNNPNLRGLGAGMAPPPPANPAAVPRENPAATPPSKPQASRPIPLALAMGNGIVSDSGPNPIAQAWAARSNDAVSDEEADRQAQQFSRDQRKQNAVKEDPAHPLPQGNNAVHQPGWIAGLRDNVANALGFDPSGLPPRDFDEILADLRKSLTGDDEKYMGNPSLHGLGLHRGGDGAISRIAGWAAKAMRPAPARIKPWFAPLPQHRGAAHPALSNADLGAAGHGNNFRVIAPSKPAASLPALAAAHPPRSAALEPYRMQFPMIDGDNDGDNRDRRTKLTDQIAALDARLKDQSLTEQSRAELERERKFFAGKIGDLDQQAAKKRDREAMSRSRSTSIPLAVGNGATDVGPNPVAEAWRPGRSTKPMPSGYKGDGKDDAWTGSGYHGEHKAGPQPTAPPAKHPDTIMPIPHHAQHSFSPTFQFEIQNRQHIHDLISQVSERLLQGLDVARNEASLFNDCLMGSLISQGM